MNTEQESNFIQAFVRRERRERSRYELLSKKRRSSFINRLCHRYDDIFDARYLKQIPPPNSDCTTILRLLQQKGASDQCYAISASDEIDGKTITLSEALHKAVGYGLPTVLICIPGRLAYFEAEQEIGSPPRYLLVRSQRAAG